MRWEIFQSYVDDGTMSSQKEGGEDYTVNRVTFLERHGVSADQTTLVRLRYEGEDYCRYQTVDSALAGDGILRPSSLVVDALWTRERNVALLLPLADCIGAVLYDEKKKILGLAHLGRHNLVQFGGTKSITYMKREFDSKPEDIIVYLSPAAGSKNYPLHDFDNRSMHDVAKGQFIEAGVPEANIGLDPRDTTKDSMFFSHSQFLKGKRETDGRHAIATMLRD